MKAAKTASSSGVNMKSYFEDPRGRQSEALAQEAERAEREGQLARARELYLRAATLEEAVALEVPGTAPRVRSVLAVSAVALWLRAEAWSEAARAARAFLNEPDHLTEQVCADLRSLLDRSLVEREVNTEQSGELSTVLS